MTLARMTDRSLPLAERVAEMVGLFRLWPKGYPEASDDLLADIAAADRLARDVASYHDALETWQADGSRPWKDVGEGPFGVFMATLAAYRARMAHQAKESEDNG